MNEPVNRNSLKHLAMPDWLRERLTRHAVFMPSQLCDLLELWLAAEELPSDINRDEVGELHPCLLRDYPALAKRKRSDFVMPPPGIAEGEPPQPDKSEPGQIGIEELIGPDEGSDPEREEPDESQEFEEPLPDSGEDDSDERRSTDGPDKKSTTDDSDRSEQDNRDDRSKGEG